MKEFEYIDRFKRKLIFKWSGIIISVASIFPIAVFRVFIGDTLAGIIALSGVFIGILLLSMYRCPSCGTTLDPRIPARKMKHCNGCGCRLRL